MAGRVNIVQSTVALIFLGLLCVSQVWATATARVTTDDPIEILIPGATATGIASCSKVESSNTNIRVQEIKVARFAGDVAFTRSYFDGASVNDYVDASQTLRNSPKSFKECAELSAAEGMHGFEHSGSMCTSYVFQSYPCSCTPGDTVIYVDLTKVDKLPSEPQSVPSETDEYISVQLDLTILNSVDLSDVGLDVVSSATTFEDCLAYEAESSPAFTFSNGVCTNFRKDTLVPAEGVGRCVGGTTVYKRKTFEASESRIFIDSCGTTIETPRLTLESYSPGIIYSHQGFVYEPLPEKDGDCVVTFARQNECDILVFEYTPLFLDSNDACTEGDSIKFDWYIADSSDLTEQLLCVSSEIPDDLKDEDFGLAVTQSESFTVKLSQDGSAKTSTGFLISLGCLLSSDFQ